LIALPGAVARSCSPAHVFITGASSGIGAALARCYARRGAHLSLTARNAARTETVAQECREAGAEVRWQAADVTDRETLSAWIEDCDQRQPIDMVIANAGLGGERVIASPAGEQLSLAREIVETNILGVANTVIPLLPRFVARGSGHVVLMSSLAAYVGLPEAPLYSASKAAIRIYGQGLHRLLGPSGVRVTVVCPGFVATPMSQSIPGHLPLLWSAERAAAFIVKRLARDRREIAFPWPLAVLAKLASTLPVQLVDSLLDRKRRSPA